MHFRASSVIHWKLKKLSQRVGTIGLRGCHNIIDASILILDQEVGEEGHTHAAKTTFRHGINILESL